MQRTRMDVLRELDAVERQIASKQKTLFNTTNHNTVAICEATIPALERKAEALRQEAMGMPEDTPRTFHASGNFKCLTRTAMFTDQEIEEFPEIPPFLRRVKTGAARITRD